MSPGVMLRGNTVKPSLVATCALALACDAASPPTALQSRSSAESSPLGAEVGTEPDAEVDADIDANAAAPSALAPTPAPGAAPAERPAAAADAAPSSVETPPVEAPPAEAPPVETPAPEPPSVGADAPTVTVSFTFDDTYGPQLEAASILDAHGLRGTFYVNSPELHRASANPAGNGPLSIAEVLDMQARGHDIGGHSLGHLSLTDIPESERIREIMGDRAQLLQLGLEARSFAYPYGHVEADDAELGQPVLEIARASGYTSARDTNGFNLDDCGTGPESLPPRDPFQLTSIRSVNEPPEGAETRVPADTAETLLGWLDRAAACGGGWLPLVFHRLDADCAGQDPPQSYCFDFGELDALAAAVATGVRCPSAGDGPCYRVQAETVSRAIGDGELAPAPEVPGLRNPSLERALDSGATECIRRTGASEAAVFSRSELANEGQASERLEIASPVDEPAEIGVERDFGACSIFVQPGNAYGLSLHYRADPEGELPTLRLVTYRLTADYVWETWEVGADFSARSPGEWVRLELATGSVPEGTIAISFGLRQESPGAINVDDFDSVPLGVIDVDDDDD
jgi:peptidoglycan/xylan/chitin deacetylase (PgdA/CDA1 family)